MMGKDGTKGSVTIMALLVEVRVCGIESLNKFVDFVEVGMEQFGCWIAVEDDFMVLGVWRRSNGTCVSAKGGGTVEIGEGLFGKKIVWADIFRQDLSCVLIRYN